MVSPPSESTSGNPAASRLVVLLALAALWVFLMVWRLESRSLQVDEFLTCYRTESRTLPEDFMHPRTYYLYMRTWVQIAGSTDAALRLAGLLPAVVAVAGTGLLAWWLLPWPGPVAAMALVCLSSELLLYWRMARYFAPVAGAFCLAMVGAVGYLRTGRGRWLLLLAVGTALTAYSDYLPALTLILPWGWVLVRALRKRESWSVWPVVAAAVTTVTAVLPAVLWACEGSRQVTHPFRADSGSVALLKGGLAAWSLLASEVVPPWQLQVAAPLVLSSLTLLLVGTRFAWRQDSSWRLLLVIWPFAVAVVWVMLCFVPREPPVRIGSLALHALPCALLVIALGWYQARTTWWASTALALVLAGHLIGLGNYFTLRNHLNPQYALDWRQVADFLNREVGPKDAVVTFFDAGLYRYYHHPGPREEAVSLRRDGPARLARVLKNGHRVWLVTRDRGSTDARKLAQQLIAVLEDLGARSETHSFLRYGPQERAWRSALTPGGASQAYVTVLEFGMPSGGMPASARGEPASDIEIIGSKRSGEEAQVP